MKNPKNNITLNIQRIFSYSTNLIPIIAVSFLLFIGCCSSTRTMAQQVNVGVNVRLPFWAPAYDNLDIVQYYYLPDIECYYDVWNQEYVYLEDGNWMFAAQLPPFYSWYDFNANPFVVILDWHVHQPWMHHHFYVSHYPRYYYRTVYRNDSHPLCGFNENAKSVVYNRTTVVNKIIEPRREPVSRDQKVVATHPPQRMEYYGKNVGQPVRVEKQMKRPPATMHGMRAGRK